MNYVVRHTILLCVFVLTGCTSMRSTMLNRSDDNSFAKNGCPTKGVPVRVRVPTHLDLAVLETVYLENQLKDESKGVKFEPVKFDRRNLRVESQLVLTEKIMTVDLKRPAAGTLEYNLGFDKDKQSLTQIESFLYDRTMRDVANMVAALVPNASQQTVPETASKESWSGSSTSAMGGTTTAAAGQPIVGTGLQNRVLPVDRVVAYQRFDLNACDFEEQVASFLDRHLNQCHDCCPPRGEALVVETARRSVEPQPVGIVRPFPAP